MTASFFDVVCLAAMRNYEHIQQILPIIVFFAAYKLYHELCKTNELSIMRIMGVSTFNVALPSISISLIFAVLCLFILNPIGSYMMIQYEASTHIKFRSYANYINYSNNGIWLQDKTPHSGQIDKVLHASKMDSLRESLIDVTVFIMDNKWTVKELILADSATFNENQIILHNAKIIGDINITAKKQLDFSTNITFAQMQDSILPPYVVPFIKLPSFILDAQNAGFDVLKHIVYFARLLFLPFSFAAMVFTALMFIDVTPRKVHNIYYIAYPAIFAIILHFLNDIVIILGTNGALNPFFAAILPSLLCLSMCAVYRYT